LNRGVMFQYFEWNCKSDGSLWRELAGRANELKQMGVSAVWTPPPYKGLDGANETGYAVYDIYDLGEFDQKTTVRTKYGTREEYLAAIKSLQDAGIAVYADVVLNHRLGGDNTEEVEVVEVNCDDRNVSQSEPYKIHAFSHYGFPGRKGKYSQLQLHWQHFNAFGFNADTPEIKNKIYRVKEKTFSGEVCFEHGNFDYLMGADVDHYHPEVQADLRHWGPWLVETTNVNGFRLDAVKHIPASFFKQWLPEVRARFPQRELFAVGEYWSGDVKELEKYLGLVDGIMHLFDVPLHFNFQKASQQGRDFDLTKIFNDSLVQRNPLRSVTFVDNHDSQPGQGLESTVLDWFKPMAYALIMLRNDGYPCLFYGDYYGNDDPKHKLVSHRKLMDDFLYARREFMFGEQRDYLDHPTCIGWCFTGDAGNPRAMGVLMSSGDAGVKRMNAGQPGKTFRDLTGHCPEPVVADDKGEVEFLCPPGKISVWCSQ
jgi:alpha-amylase